MNIFGIRIIFESDYQAAVEAIAECNRTLHTLRERDQTEFWKAKYYYAKARAVVAEQFHRNTIITVKPVAMGVDSGISIEVGHASETEIREQ